MTRHVGETTMRLIGRSVVLRLATPDDAAFILGLRQDGALNRHLSATGGGVEQQRAWLEAYQERERRGVEYYFVIETPQGEPVGTIRLYDRAGDSCQWGSWVVRPGAPAWAALESALLLLDFAFERLGCRRVYCAVDHENRSVVAFHARYSHRTRRDERSQHFEMSPEEYRAMRRSCERYSA
jgi:RimJ/RimL family protein N-acetyltransferase